MCVSPQDLGCGGGGSWAMGPDGDWAISPGRDHGERKSQPDEAAWRNRQVRTSAGTAGGGRRACRDEKRVVKRAEICEARVVKRQDWCATRHLMCTMRVGVHQSEDRDAQRVPQLPHHQPAVHVRDAFALSHKRHHDFRLTVASLFFFFFFSQETVFWGTGFKFCPAHTVIMMQGDSFAQKSSSSSLWNVASFSTIRTNLAEEAISAHWLRSAQRQPSTNNDTQVDVLKYKELRGKTRDISDPANVWRDSNCLKWQRCVVSKHPITEPIFATQYKQIQDCDSVDFM